MSGANLGALKSRRQAIAQEIARLKAEDAEVAIAMTVLQRLIRDPAQETYRAPQAQAPVKAAASARASQKRRKSQHDHVLDALKRSKAVWVETDRLLDLVEELDGVALPVKSVRPLLTVMRNKGEIVRQGRRIAHADRAKERGAKGPQA